VIVDAILDFLQGIVIFLIELIPDFELPDFTSEGAMGTALGGLADVVRPWSYWFPVTWFAGIVGTVFLAARATDLVGLALRVFSLLTGGGASSD